VPTVKRSRTVAAEPEAVWRVVTDPERLPDWWPGVQRVEEATAATWTMVLASPRGKAVRADYTRLEARPPHQLVWRHEVAESPFERILSESLVTFELEPAADAATRVAITARQRTRGFARFGFVQLRRAARRQLDAALDGLERVLGAA
jgi:uncharacterized protein YndB with AHSA1/START domain